MAVTIALATEDILSEEVGLRMVCEAAPNLIVTQKLRKGGNGYLRSRIPNFCQMAHQMPVLLLTDLDTVRCPILLKNTWLRNLNPPGNLIFRVVVREIEAWLLADHEAMVDLLKNGAKKIPVNVDDIADPKRELLQLARKAPKDVQIDLLPSPGAIASRGLGYNQRLVHFIRDSWQPQRAAERSESLKRALARLSAFAAAVATR